MFCQEDWLCATAASYKGLVMLQLGASGVSTTSSGNLKAPEPTPAPEHVRAQFSGSMMKDAAIAGVRQRPVALRLASILMAVFIS